MAPYHNVPNLIIIAVPIAEEVDKPNNSNNPEIVTSATPKPPGIILMAPTSDEKLKINVEIIILICSLNPKTTTNKPKHSKNQAKIPKIDIPIIVLVSIRVMNVACVWVMSFEYLPALFSNNFIIFRDIKSDFILIKKIKNKIVKIMSK